MVTMADVARRAGVSTATVSRVLNKPIQVDSRTQEIVRTVISELQYRPNATAQGLASRSSKTIGVVINNFGSAYYGRMVDGVEHGLQSVGYKTIAESSRESLDGEYAAFNSLLERQCEAVIVHSDSMSDEEVALLFERNPKAVLLNRLVVDVRERCVYLDNVKGAELAARHLLDRGHRKFAMIEGPGRHYQVRERRLGFKNVLREAGVEIHPKLIASGEFTYESGMAVMSQLVGSGERFTSVFCHSDEIAFGALNYCLEKGIRVPDEISIIGFDDLRMSSQIWPKLTTISQPLRDIGVAAGLLAHKLATGSDPDCPIQQIFEPEVAERDTVRSVEP